MDETSLWPEGERLGAGIDEAANSDVGAEDEADKSLDEPLSLFLSLDDCLCRGQSDGRVGADSGVEVAFTSSWLATGYCVRA